MRGRYAPAPVRAMRAPAPIRAMRAPAPVHATRAPLVLKYALYAKRISYGHIAENGILVTRIFFPV